LAFLEIRQTLYCFTFVPPKFHHPLFSVGLKHMLPCMFYVMCYVPSHMHFIFVYLDGTKNSSDFSFQIFSQLYATLNLNKGDSNIPSDITLKPRFWH
jgi:hypothetical protein